MRPHSSSSFALDFLYVEKSFVFTNNNCCFYYCQAQVAVQVLGQFQVRSSRSKDKGQRPGPGRFQDDILRCQWDERSRWNVYLMKWKSMVNMTCENHHGYGLVALQQQRQMSVVDDDQRHSTLLGCLLEVVGWLLEPCDELGKEEQNCNSWRFCLALPLIDNTAHIFEWNLS